MKKLITIILILFAIQGMAQDGISYKLKDITAVWVANTLNIDAMRVANATSLFDRYLPEKTIVYNTEENIFWKLKENAKPTQTLMTTEVKYSDINALVKSFNNIFVELFFEYEKDCYNDSTKICKHEFIKTDSLEQGVYAGYEQYICRWHHKEPTFADFIQWVKGDN